MLGPHNWFFTHTAHLVCREEEHTGRASVRALLFLPEEPVETGAPVCLGRCESAPALRKGAGDPDRPLGLPCEALVCSSPGVGAPSGTAEAASVGSILWASGSASLSPGVLWATAVSC